MYLKLVPILLISACISKSDQSKQVIYLSQKSTDAINNVAEIQLNRIKIASNDYPKKHNLLQKATLIDSTITKFHHFVTDSNSTFLGHSKSEYLIEYHKTIEDINQIIRIDSFVLPEWYKFNLETSTLDLEILDKDILLPAMQLNLALIKVNAYEFLNLMFPSGVEDWFGKTVFVINDKIENNAVQLDLTSRVFSKYDKQIITIDSAFLNGKDCKINVMSSEEFIFNHLSIDSLLPGKYKIFGRVSSYPNDIEVSEPFSYEFEINKPKLK
jgi:hypothetical protein